MGGSHGTRNDGRHSLEDLGIVISPDAYGENRLTITLPPNPLFGTGEAQAIFDPATKKWDLAVTGNTRFGVDAKKTFIRKDSVPSRNGPPPRRVRWTEGLPKDEHVDTILNDIDWEATSFGPLEKWPIQLQAYLNIVLADPLAATLYWGDDLGAIYNKEFIGMITARLTKGQNLLGAPFKVMWPELWEDFKPMLKSIAAEGKGIQTMEVYLFPIVNGVPEETIWEGGFLAIRDDAGTVRGFYNRAREVTKNIVNERRARVLSAIASKPNLTGDFIFKHLIDCLALSDRDFPLAFVYSAHEDVVAGKCSLKYQCGLGLPEEGHSLVPDELELYEGHTGFVPYYRKAKGQDKAFALHSADGTLHEELIAGFQWGGYGEPSRTLAFLPLSTSDRLLGMLVIGLNPRRPYDEDHEGFLSTLLRSISATVSSAIDREEARNRAERLARQLEDTERSIREIAEYGPVGIARLSRRGKLEWANDQYYEITGHGRDEEEHYEMSFMDTILENDRETAEKSWSTLASDHKAVSSAVRIKKTWHPPPGPNINEHEKQQNVWVLVSGYPMMDEKDVRAYAVSVTDISRFKWAEQVQSQFATAAKEAKRLQENFIDIVSHEMRNPLSAITQLSDAISTSMEDFELTQKREADAREVLKTNIDSANTILICAAHQKRIIDDVLTLSKLDSSLLSVTPAVVQPYEILKGVLRMFEAEFKASDIKIHSERAKSYIDSRIDWVSIDPSRLTQIFINLITNAIKFTKLESERRISVRISAVEQQPPSLAGVKWFPTNKQHTDLTLGSDWGQGQPVYICFEVQDTGRGLEQQEMNKLFGKFQQATEQTKHQYGGSGLGLYISRELTETQGGEMGVMSERGKGTTFVFYVKGRRAEAPKDPAVLLQTTKSAKLPKGPSRASSQQQVAQLTDPSVTRRLSILLCEDNMLNSKVLKQQLEKANCDVQVANHGAEALDILGKSRSWQGKQQNSNAIDFDAVLMDVEMPVMDGLTCTRRIRQVEKEKKLAVRQVVIAVTGNARKEQIDTAMEAGVDGVLPKPFRVKECLEKIRPLLRRESDQAKRPRTD